MQAKWALVSRIASLARVCAMMVMAARLGIRMRVADVSVNMASVFKTDVRMGLNMVSPQRHGANAGDYQR